MQHHIIIDAEPLVEFIDCRDRFHGWAKDVLANTQMPLLTCEAVLSETRFLLRRHHQGQDEVVTLSSP